MKLTEAKIKEAQAVIEAVMEECNFWSIDFSDTPWVSCYPNKACSIHGDDLAELYVNRLHELAGTTPPPF